MERGIINVDTKIEKSGSATKIPTPTSLQLMHHRLLSYLSSTIKEGQEDKVTLRRRYYGEILFYRDDGKDSLTHL